MGNSVFWFQPVGSAILHKVDLGRVWSDMQVEPKRVGADTSPSWGAPVRTDLGGFRDVRLIRERIQNDASLIRSLEAMVYHLQTGGRISAALDEDKAWATWSNGPLLAGGTTLSVSPSSNAFAHLNGSAALTAGDEMIFHSPNPEHAADVNTYSGVSGGTLTVQSNFKVGPVLWPVFARYRWFFPALRLPASRMNDPGLLTHDRLLNWTLDLPLEEAPGDIEALREAYGALASSTAEGKSMDDVIAETAPSSASRAQARTRRTR